jgi:MoaA/NifB/PqqE/SkfB family radical SAM enzyme
MNKDFLLKESKVFCMLPWVHLHTTPTGIASPCCISKSVGTVDGMGSSKHMSLMQLVNSEKMKQLRLDMLNGITNTECHNCHQAEMHNPDRNSFRQSSNDEWNEFFNEVVPSTNIDGSLNEFKMRYFDIRFNNICNFKCRTCTSEFSSQLEQENLKNKVIYARVHPKNNDPRFLKNVLDQIENISIAYFAGGEPLITEEHYIILEEMIRQGRTDIILKYNTNLSNLKFKNKDLLGLWKHFTKGVNVWASIDHYGERAEYIRNGTDWATVEENFVTIKKLPYVNLGMNTVLSVFNLLTIDKFYQYLIDKNLYRSSDISYSLYNTTGPEFISCHMLPEEYKLLGKQSLESTINLFTKHNFNSTHISYPKQSIHWLFSDNTWEQNRELFRKEVARLDGIRGEDFVKTFPELAGLL